MIDEGGIIVQLGLAIIFIISCIAVPSVQGQMYEGQIMYATSPDVGEVSSGNYGETSITYSSYSGTSGGYSSYPGTPQHTSFSTQPANTQPQTVQQTATQQGMTSTLAQTFQAPQPSDQRTLLSYNILANQPASVFYNQVMLPWQTFVSTFPKNMPMFWINTQAGWQWYATCPLGGWAQEIMFIPQTGALGVYEVYPDRTTKFYDYGYATPGYHYIWFNGDTPGRHTCIVTVDRLPSNAVAFDVI